MSVILRFLSRATVMESSHCTLNLAPVILTILQSSPSPSGPDESGEECGITITVIGPDGEEIPTS
ncbi:hypothetical protein AcV5_006583 [Taiwanofungus camphoratus]|nr:hypothetical protein AcV5_006583 [Antrodia cinnamomea]